MLEQHPWFELSMIAASGKSAGNKYGEFVNWCLIDEMPDYIKDKIIEPIDINNLKEQNIEIIFSALPANIAKDIEMKLAAEGFKVFSNASAYRMAESVPLLIADVNPHHLALVNGQLKKSNGFLVTNPNCCVTGLATVLKPIAEEFRINNVSVTTYQALSGAGYPGVPSMDITDNILPYISGEEEKVESECKRILGEFNEDKIKPETFEVIANCARVPVRDGHLEAVVIDFENEIDPNEIKSALTEFQALSDKSLPTVPQNTILIATEENRPQPMLDLYAGSPARARGMAVTVGRFKKSGNKMRFFLLVHNTIRGAAGCSIMNAELAKHDGFL
jgi:aspartate-semialdehyde dehydrogenase